MFGTTMISCYLDRWLHPFWTTVKQFRRLSILYYARWPLTAPFSASSKQHPSSSQENWNIDLINTMKSESLLFTLHRNRYNCEYSTYVSTVHVQYKVEEKNCSSSRQIKMGAEKDKGKQKICLLSVANKHLLEMNEESWQVGLSSLLVFDWVNLS